MQSIIKTAQMTRYLYLFAILLLLISCHPKKENTSNQYKKEFYAVLIHLIQSEFKDVAVILNETKPVYITVYGIFVDSMKSDFPPPPPPPGIISYDKGSFDCYIKRKYLDSNDAAFMYKSIDSTVILQIDASEVAIPLITKNEWAKMFNKEDSYEGYNNLVKLYGKRSYIIVSTPVFNENFTKVIISIDYYCGPTCGEGHIFILEKKNDNWSLVYEGGTWVS